MKMHTLLGPARQHPHVYPHYRSAKLHDGQASSTRSAPSPAPSTSWIGPTSISTRLFVFTLCSSFFVVRTKKNILLQRRYSHPVDRSTGVRSDQTVILGAIESSPSVSGPVAAGQLLRHRDEQAAAVPDQQLRARRRKTIAEIYRSRWQVELFFRWIKQHLRPQPEVLRRQRERREDPDLDRRLGLRAGRDRVSKRLGLEASLYQILQIRQRYPFRENAHSYRPCRYVQDSHENLLDAPQPTDSIRLLTGQ